MKDKKKTPRQVAGEKLLAVYAKLPPSKRDVLQKTLLEHAFLSQGQAYIEWADWNESARAVAYLELKDVSQDTAHNWLHWAAAIETEGCLRGPCAKPSLDWLGSSCGFGTLNAFSHRPTSEVDLRHLRLETQCFGKVVYETPRIERDLAPTAIAAFRRQFLILRGIHERVTNELPVGD
jgi:hypothetical protein